MKDRKRIAKFVLDDFISKDPDMQGCLALAREAANTDIPILLEGETGTGKTLLAQAIHNSSERAAETFVSFNSSAMTDTLLESQLFGHEKGAFTGATNQLRGKFEVAHKGTMFFDEIADMSPMAQAKILRAIEYGEFERLGAEVTHYADVRIISATNRSLRQLTRTREFREDLYHRLNGLTLVLPPLRQRRKDLDGLIAGELNRTAAAAGKTITGIDPDALDRLKAYEWPGNLRELHRVIQTVVLFTTGDTVMPEHVILDDQRGSARNRAPQSRADSEPAPPVPDSDDLTLETAVRRHCQYVYGLTGNNKRQTARVLGISRSTLERKLDPE